MLGSSPTGGTKLYEIWHPTGFVNFYSTDLQTVYFERGEAKRNVFLPQIN